jgi:exodeoxyribonuclease V beta subunit
VKRDRRVNELEFLLPAPQAARSQLTAKGLATAFAKHRTEKVPAAYVDQLGKLGFLPLRGFLIGFVDLVFEHDGRFYVVDYKSNHLGDAASDYAPARLTTAMSHANYFLQYHLYVVAVHRWLGRRLRGYDYDRSFGGVLYLFARGMSPSHAPGTGIFFDRPKRELVDAISEVLAHG